MEIHSQVFWVRLVSGSLLLAFAGLIFIANWRIFYDNFILRQASSSWTPLLGGILGAIGLLTIPFINIGGFRFYWIGAARRTSHIQYGGISLLGRNLIRLLIVAGMIERLIYLFKTGITRSFQNQCFVV